MTYISAIATHPAAFVECTTCRAKVGASAVLCDGCLHNRSALALLSAPILMLLHCPVCGVQHIDSGEWETRAHKTHLCAACGHEWRPTNRATVGVEELR